MDQIFESLVVGSIEDLEDFIKGIGEENAT